MPTRASRAMLERIAARGRPAPVHVLCAAGLLAIGIGLGPSSARIQPTCAAPRELLQFTAPLERVQRIVQREQDIRIVALGSSSTQGVGASSPKTCYPARLEAELNLRFFPDKHFEVVNLGVGGQLARDMLARIESDVLPLKPHLVIWQTGVNDAIQNVRVAEFKRLVEQGIDTLTQRGIDVVLIDHQYYPGAARVPLFNEYLVAMRQIAQSRNVPILRRHAIMKHLIDSEQFTETQLLSADQFHQNDLSYGCLGGLLADAIGDNLVRAAAKRRLDQSEAAQAPASR